jgi:hypothetical protein
MIKNTNSRENKKEEAETDWSHTLEMTGSNREDCSGLDPQQSRRGGEPRHSRRGMVEELSTRHDYSVI